MAQLLPPRLAHIPARPKRHPKPRSAGMGAVRGAWDRWLGYQHGGYERLDDERNEQQQQRGRNVQNRDPNCPPGWI